MEAQFTIRRARSSDADEISRLISIFAAEALMLKRTPGMVEGRPDTRSTSPLQPAARSRWRRDGGGSRCERHRHSGASPRGPTA